MELAKDEGAYLKKICSASKQQCDIRRTFFHVRANGVFKKKQRGGYASHLTRKGDEFKSFLDSGASVDRVQKGIAQVRVAFRNLSVCNVIQLLEVADMPD